MSGAPAQWFSVVQFGPQWKPGKPPGCFEAVRAELAQAGGPMSLRDLRAATGGRYSATDMGSALVKMVKRGWAIGIPPSVGRKGKVYLWADDAEAESGRSSADQSHQHNDCTMDALRLG